MLDAALAYADAGWPVFPLLPGGKTPAGGHGFKDATVDPDQIAGWWGQTPDANIGVATGAAGLVVIDVDAKSFDANGWTTWLQFCADHAPGGLEPATFEVATPTGGGHLYLAAPPGPPIRNSAGKLAPNVDVRAHGGYVVAPPSVTSDGRYETDPARPVVPCPDWLTRRLRPVRTALAAAPPRGRTAYGTAALTAETAEVAAAPEGTRNHRLNEAAFAAGQLVSRGDLEPSDAVACLLDAAVRAGLGEREATATIASGLRAGHTNPRAR